MRERKKPRIIVLINKCSSGKIKDVTPYGSLTKMLSDNPCLPIYDKKKTREKLLAYKMDKTANDGKIEYNKHLDYTRVRQELKLSEHFDTPYYRITRKYIKSCKTKKQ